MSQETKAQVLARLRRRYVKAGPEHIAKLLDQAVELVGCHRKAAIRALRPTLRQRGAGPAGGRPPIYEPGTREPILKPLWFTAS